MFSYSPISASVVSEPGAIFPFLGCSRLAEPHARRGVIAAFHGQAHERTLEGEAAGGVKVFNVARPTLMKVGYSTPSICLNCKFPINS